MSILGVGADSPNRLLREEWDSPVALAQELYAMMTAKGPTQINDTLTIRVPEGRPALRIERVQDGDTFTTEIKHGGVTRNSVATSPATPGRRTPPSAQEQARGFTLPAIDTAQPRTQHSALSTQHSLPGSSRQVPLVEVAGPVLFSGSAPVQFETLPVFRDPVTGQEQTLAEAAAQQLPSYTPIPSADPYFGIVLSGKGDTYQVGLVFGPIPPADQEINLDQLPQAAVKIPYIAPGEQIPAETRIWPIIKVKGTYYYQPPVWLAAVSPAAKSGETP